MTVSMMITPIVAPTVIPATVLADVSPDSDWSASGLLVTSRNGSARDYFIVIHNIYILSGFLN